MTTVRTILAVATMRHWITCQMDVTNVFSHGDLEEDVYMKLPKGYKGKGEPIMCSSKPTNTSQFSATIICKLKKSLYGLKQAPRQWFAKLSPSLLAFGFQQSKADYSLFTRQIVKGYIAVLVYVDDMLITEDSPSLINQLKSHLNN